MRSALASIAFVAMLVGAYAVSCWWYPFGSCWCCKGLGRHMRDDRKVQRLCRWCKGSGRRRRVGRRLYEWHTMRGGRT